MKTKSIKFEIVGSPVGKARPRVTRKGFAYTPEKTKNYEAFIKKVFVTKYPCHEPFSGVIEAKIEAIFEIPKSYSKKKRKEIEAQGGYQTVKPDIDNVIKSVLDSLNGLAYTDDSKVSILHIEKKYGDTPKVVVELTEK